MLDLRRLAIYRDKLYRAIKDDTTDFNIKDCTKLNDVLNRLRFWEQELHDIPRRAMLYNFSSTKVDTLISQARQCIREANNTLGEYLLEMFVNAKLEIRHKRIVKASNLCCEGKCKHP